MIQSVVAVLLQYDHLQLGQSQALRALHGRYEEVDYLTIAKNEGSGRANQCFVSMVGNVKPDWVWMQLQDSDVITADSIIAARQSSPNTVFVHWTGDVRPSVSEYLSSICKATDMTLVSSVGKLSQFREAGASVAEYLQIGVDWSEDVLGLPAWEPPYRVSEVVFCGGYYATQFPGTTDREQLIIALSQASVDVGVVGPSWPGGVPVAGVCTVKQQHHVYKRAKVALSVNHFNDIEQYYSDRQLIAMASGTPTVCKYIPGLEREFTNGKHCLWYDRVDEGVAHVKKLLADEALRRCVGSAGRAEVMKNHSWFSRFTDVMTKVEKLAETRRG